MNYLVESAISHGHGKCPLQMTRIKDQDYLVDLRHPEPAQTKNMSLGEDANCLKLVFSSSKSGKEIYEIPLCGLQTKQVTPDEPCPWHISLPSVIRTPPNLAPSQVAYLAIFDSTRMSTFQLKLANNTKPVLN